jgi:hypothetical protein
VLPIPTESLPVRAGDLILLKKHLGLLEEAAVLDVGQVVLNLFASGLGVELVERSVGERDREAGRARDQSSGRVARSVVEAVDKRVPGA